MSRKCFFIFGILGFFGIAVADVSLPRIFQDKMVFQRGESISVWGNATPGEHVEVSFGSDVVKTITDVAGNWELELPPRLAGGPFILRVSSAQNELSFEDVYLGDVWVLSGQSNAQVSFNYFLEQPIEQHYIDFFTSEIQRCGDEILIRNYMVACKNDQKEYIRNESENRWFESNPDDIAEVSPIAYYFAREISRKTSVMTAVVRISWGGNVIEKFYKNSNNYEHMLKPWAKQKIKGVIWYQGESNIINQNDGLGYALKLQLLMRDYRELWDNPELPFLIVQMPPALYSERPLNNSISLPLFLEGQRQALQIPFTSMAVASDLGMANGLHPPQKYELAIRLANLAFANVYQIPDAIPAGPQFERTILKDDKIMAIFETFGSTLITKDGNMPTYFEIAGREKVFKSAQAKIEGNTVVLWNEEIDKPYHVRYGFDEKALMKLNLTNVEGIPVAVFWSGADPQLHAP
jgi:sialate O-acetylesterase